jgi:hypothetical protein
MPDWYVQRFSDCRVSNLFTEVEGGWGAKHLDSKRKLSPREDGVSYIKTKRANRDIGVPRKRQRRRQDAGATRAARRMAGK